MQVSCGPNGHLHTPSVPHAWPCGPFNASQQPQRSERMFSHLVNTVTVGSNFRQFYSTARCGSLISRQLPTSLESTVNSRSENYTQLRFCTQQQTHAHMRTHTPEGTLTAQLHPSGLGERPETGPRWKHGDKKPPLCRREGRVNSNTRGGAFCV